MEVAVDGRPVVDGDRARRIQVAVDRVAVADEDRVVPVAPGRIGAGVAPAQQRAGRNRRAVEDGGGCLCAAAGEQGRQQRQQDARCPALQGAGGQPGEEEREVHEGTRVETPIPKVCIRYLTATTRFR